MAVMRIFYSEALTPDLASLYHNIRTIPLSYKAGSRTGHDMPCEMLHRAISAGVVNHVSPERIGNFIRAFPFLQRGKDMLHQWLLAGRKDKQTFMKDMDADVQKLKQWFVDKVGADWRAATRRNSNSQLGLASGKLPWKEVAETSQKGGEDAVAAYVARHARSLLLAPM